MTLSEKLTQFLYAIQNSQMQRDYEMVLYLINNKHMMLADLEIIDQTVRRIQVFHPDFHK